MTPLRKGDRVKIRFRDRLVDADVTLASENGRSLALSFEAVLGPYAGAMAVLGDTADGPFVDLVLQEPVAIALTGRP